MKFTITLLLSILFIIQIFLSYSVYYNGKYFYETRQKKGKIKPKVFDIMYKYLPDMSDSKVLDHIIDLLIIIPILFITIKSSKNPELYKDYIMSVILIQLIRSIFIHSTILPKTKDCVNKKYKVYNILFGHCYDKIFSGHLSTTIITSIFLYQMNIFTNLNVLVIYNTILAILLLLARSHYTVDLLVALLASYSVYNIHKSVFHFF